MKPFLMLCLLIGVCTSAHGGFNTIELRCDDPTGQSIQITTVQYPVIPQKKFKLAETNPDVWKGETKTSYGTAYNLIPLWNIECRYLKPDGFTKLTKRPYLLNRNRPKDIALQQEMLVPCSKSNKLANTSFLLKNHASDWEALRDTALKILADRGISMQSPEEERASALADFCHRLRSGDHDHLHPVDYVKHGASCAGASNTFIALSGFMGLQSRQITFYDHAFVEVRIDGK